MRLRGFKDGDNLTILNTYYKRMKDEKGNFKDLLTIVFKDNSTGIKYKEEIECPDYTYYIAKPDKRVNYNRLFISADDAIERVCPKMDLDKCVAKDLGLTNWYYDCLKSGDRERARQIHSHPDVFGTDIHIEDLYRFQFGEQFQNEIIPVTKSYFDIETDTVSMIGDFPMPGECPINAITVVFQESMQVFTLLLRNKNNPQIAEFEQFIQEDKYADLAHFIEHHCNKDGQDLYHKYHLDQLKFNMAFYDEDDEICLIQDAFILINLYKPDFVLAWNMAFDIPYIIQRIINLGYRPEEIMCHPDFKFPFAEYFIDERNKNVFSERGDYATISSYSVYMDQMIQYASRRKGQTSDTSYSLDVIGTKVSKIGKLDYKDVAQSIVDLPYKNYKIFVYYNIMDTLVQYCTESVTGDIDYTFGKTLANNTRYQKVHRQTTYLTNRGKKEFLHSDNLILGNNFNKNNEKPTTKFPGAFVADPLKVSNYSKMVLNGIPIFCFNNSQDSDYASLYPNIINQFNIAGNTQIGKVIIPNKIHDAENRRHNEHWERAGSFFEDFHTQNWIIVGSKWFNLPGIVEMYRFIQTFFNTQVMPSSMYGFEEGDRLYTQPVIISNGDGWAPIVFDPPINKEKIGEFRNHVANNPNQHF